MASFCLASVSAQTSIPDPNFWVTDGPVHAVKRSEKKVFIGGAFKFVGPNAPFGAAIHAVNGKPDLTYARPNGRVLSVIPDGSGGWFIGGEFTSVNGIARRNLAHINNDGRLDLSWNPEANGVVRSLALASHIVYIGGDFTAVNGQAVGRIAAVNHETGAWIDWNPNANGIVRAIAVHGGRVYAGGDFTQIGGQTRTYLAALNRYSASVAGWNPQANSNVHSLAADKNRLFVGGEFTRIGGQSRRSLAALDTVTAGTSNWLANPDVDGPVMALACFKNTLYVGGLFTKVGGMSRGSLAALNANNGVVLSWSPGADDMVHSLAVSGDAVYAGGDFNNVSGKERYHMAALDRLSGFPKAWTCHANTSVRCLAANDTVAYAGGEFLLIGGQRRNNLAALNAVTGAATSWNPDANGTVRALTVNGDTVYAGGDFSVIGGVPRSRIASVRAFTGAVNPWNPVLTGSVYTLTLMRGRLYAGGDLSMVLGAKIYRYLVSLHTANATPDDIPYLDGPVYALAPGGDRLYMGGAFISNGEPRNRLAALDVTSGRLTKFNPPFINDTVLAVANSGCTVYAGGRFTRIGGDARNRIAALDDCPPGASDTSDTGTPTPWQPVVSDRVRTLFLKGDTVFVGGDFTSINGQTIQRLAALKASSGLLAYWRPEANATVRTLDVAGDALYAGGDFTEIGGRTQGHFAAFTGVTHVYPSKGGRIEANQKGIPPFKPLPLREVEPPGGFQGGVRYQWQSSLVSPAEGFGDIPNATLPYYAPGFLNGTTWFKRLVMLDGQEEDEPAEESNVVEITVTPPKVWGGGDGDWNIADNWVGGALPTKDDAILIKAGNPKLNIDFTVANLLIVSESGGLIIEHGKTLTISGEADFGNRPIVFRSAGSGTAQLGEVTGRILNFCNVTVERYIPATGRRWRLLTAPLDSLTINLAWQNGQTWNGTGVLTGDSTGTLITGHQQMNAATANSRGFDFWNAISNSSASVMSYTQRAGQGVWSPLATTRDSNAFAGCRSYLLFVRGPRNRLYSTGTANAATTLRPTGCIRQGDIRVQVDGGKGFTLIGNPYASQIDFNSLYEEAFNSSIIKRQFWMWDATNGSLGNFQAVVYSNGRYIEIPAKFHTPGQSTPLTAIQSGHGFFVLPLSASSDSIVFRERHKLSSPPTLPNILLGQDDSPRLWLNLVKKTPDDSILTADGVMAAYGENHRMESTDAEDAHKLENMHENLAILNDGVSLTADARPVSKMQEPIALRTWNLSAGAYRFEAKVEGMADRGLKAFLEDRHTGTRTPLKMEGGITSIDVAIGQDAASHAEDRFRIVFEKEAVNASPTSEPEGEKRTMSIYPNPLTGRTLNVRLQNLRAGDYTLQLIANDGRIVALKNIRHEGGTSVYRVELGAVLSKGLYQLKRLNDDGSIETLRLIKQ